MPADEQLAADDGQDLREIAVPISYVHRAHTPLADQRSKPSVDTSTTHFRVFLGQVDTFVQAFEEGGLSRADTWYTYECARDVLVANLDRIAARRLDSIEGQAADAAALSETAEAPAGTEPP
jgi:hypothetical protein